MVRLREPECFRTDHQQESYTRAVNKILPLVSHIMTAMNSIRSGDICSDRLGRVPAPEDVEEQMKDDAEVRRGWMFGLEKGRTGRAVGSNVQPRDID